LQTSSKPCGLFSNFVSLKNSSVYTFFKKMTTWCDVATLNPAISKKVQTIQRNFAATEVIYKKFAVNFKKMFLCPDVDEGKAASKSSRKAKALPCTPQKVFEFCWILFVTVKADHPTEKPDLVLFMCLLYCCLDLIYANAIFDKRRDLVNLDYKGFPKDTFMDPSNDEVVCIINKLCDENETDIATEDRAYIWKPIIKKFFNDQILAGNEENFMQLITIDNFDNNFKKVNDLYERYILSCGEFDERIFLKHFKMGSKYYGGPTDDVEKSYSTNDSAGKLPTRRLLDETPLTGQRLVGSQGDSYKMTPLTCVEDNVRKLRTIKNPSRDPQPSLYKLLVTQGPEEIILDLRSRLDKMMAIFCKEYLSNSTEHFKLAEALYYHFLESMIRTEMQKNINFNIFIKDELLNKSLIVLCMEIVLYGFSRQKDFPRILDIFDLDPFHFYKLIEISIRNNTSLLTRDMIKHLTSVSICWTFCLISF
jgi:retinoblastoma-like protein 1